MLRDGVVYFAAGVWPFEGVFVYALDAKTGAPLWSNRTGGTIPRALLDHNTRREGGLSPQGYLTLLGGRLIVPSGRAMPGVMAAKTGAFMPYSTECLRIFRPLTCGPVQNLQQYGQPLVIQIWALRLRPEK